MKTTDVSDAVMKRVVTLEKGRTRMWFFRFIAVLIILGVLFVALTIRGYMLISERSGWDLLTLFYQDPEIIAAYWKDTLWIFWMELPQKTVSISIAVLGMIVIFIAITTRRRKILRKKLKQLDKYHTD
jgi:hypothetical protein